jgi:hypothetical protein
MITTSSRVVEQLQFLTAVVSLDTASVKNWSCYRQEQGPQVPCSYSLVESSEG